ncbi:hypothetical protein [Psychrobacter immobilis]|uniref:hypothetical protein n=1 Tax=Psychrobacter immobilis TaxID=498 RepID=UPI00191B786F|nr:hypothetical protein [Psychrobacter immobilis]
MLLRLSLLCTLSISVVSFAHAAEITLPKSLVVDLVEQHCSFPEPDPHVNKINKASPDLEYHCSDKYDDADGTEQSMNYSLRLLPLIRQDFNRDGIEDVVLEIESSGPLGGSVTTNSAVHYLLLDKNNRVINDHEVLLYAPFSEHIVEYEVDGTRIHYAAVPNYRSHPEAYDNGELIEPTIEFDINWIKGLPISTHYRDNCRLSEETNKQIFTTNRGVQRIATIDIHEYTQVIEEKLQINDMQVSAELDGCDAKSVSFVIQPSKGHNLPVLADILQALIPVTAQHKPLRTLLKMDQQSQIVFGEVMSLSNDWSGQVHIERGFESASVIINLSQKE